MKYFKLINTALIFSGLFLFSCQNKQEEEQQLPKGKAIANPIVYEVVVKNPNPDDEWLSECLEHTNSSSLIKDILKAVEDGRLNAYDYYDEHQLSKKEISTIINENKLTKRTGKIQFVEDWYWDKKSLRLQKEIKKIMFGYEVYTENGELRGYKASFVVDLEKVNE